MANKYCLCELPIKMFQKPGLGKVWFCSVCQMQVNPESKMLVRKIDKIKLREATRNEIILQDKINEIADLLKIL